jgi:predicted MFS family arabinose efflux permease
VFVAAVPLFLWRQRRAAEPMVALDLWADPLIASANAASLLAGMALMGITSFLPIYVQGVMGRSALVAGVALTMMAGGRPVATTLSRYFYRWIGTRGAVRLGAALMACGSVVLLPLTPTASPVIAAVGSLVMGFGMGLLSTTCIIVIQGSVEWSKRGVATSSNVFARFLGSTLGVAVLGGVLNFALGRAPGGMSSADRIRDLLAGGAQAGTTGPGHELLQRALGAGLHATFWGIFALALATLVVAVFVPAPPLQSLGRR